VPVAAALLRSQTASVQKQARCGVPEGVVTALRSTWMSWRRIWCLQGRASEATWKSANGLLQGDPTSPRRMHLRPFSSRWFGTSAVTGRRAQLYAPVGVGERSVIVCQLARSEADDPSGWQMFVG
ncbi:unnamed protein product, partial [Symbiodinium necroappetens]